MPTLQILGKWVPVDAGTELASTNGFTSSHDIGTNADCHVLQVEVVVPSGETVALSKMTVAGNEVPLLNAVTSGMYFLGENQGLMVGETLRAVSSSVVSGAREFRVNAERRG